MEEIILEGFNFVQSALRLGQSETIASDIDYSLRGRHLQVGVGTGVGSIGSIENKGVFTSLSSIPGSGSTILPSDKWRNEVEKIWANSSVEPALLRVPIVVIIFIFLWGLNLIILDKSMLQYHNALSIKNAPISFAFMWVAILLILYLVSIFIISNFLDYRLEYAVLFFYTSVVILLNIPFIPYQDTKHSFLRLLKNCIFPTDKIAFSEVLIADALTSLSKVMKDFGVTLISIFAVISNQNVVNIHNEAMILIALMASFPFFIRVRQCLVQLEGAQDFYSRLPIILNIGKYMTGFPPIWLTAIAGLGYFNGNQQLPMILAVMAGINSFYSFLWDLIMDWGFVLTNRDCKIWIRSKLHYSLVFFVVATVINLILRFSWYANRLDYFKHMHASQILLTVEIAEVFRRSMWNMFRIEWEVHDKIERSSSREFEVHNNK